MNFGIDTYNLENGVPVIKLEGEVDVYTAPQLKQQMISLLESGTKQIVIDLTKVEYFDSTALGVLIGGLKRMRERDGNLSLICPNPRIRRVFEITGLDKVFDIYNSVDDARTGIELVS
ncbi:MAG TPA: STAS domain-containing protein [Armatimonadota bacterium]|nr:STAS domain-containing protein [Armatimonadota bacterium]HOM71452.1 STAS domain-containing protein [Armatimonadota bacterium]